MSLMGLTCLLFCSRALSHTISLRLWLAHWTRGPNLFKSPLRLAQTIKGLGQVNDGMLSHKLEIREWFESSVSIGTTFMVFSVS